MKLCFECLTVNGHHPNCPEADDWDGEEEEEEQEEWESE